MWVVATPVEDLETAAGHRFVRGVGMRDWDERIADQDYPRMLWITTLIGARARGPSAVTI